MDPLRTTVFASCVILAALAPNVTRAGSAAASSGGYVDEAVFRALLDDDQDIVEINLDGAILQALAKNARDEHDDDTKDVFAKLKSIHAVIGTVKGPAEEALALVQKTDRKLGAAGWQRITRIADATSTISVLTHTVADKIDGLVVLIFDSQDKELVFANLAGEIDITQLGEIGERLNVPGLEQVPGAQ